MFTGIVEETGRILEFSAGPTGWRLKIRARIALEGLAVKMGLDPAKVVALSEAGDYAGTRVFAPIVNLREDPFVPRGLASGCFDDDGVATHARDVVKDGVLQGYFLGVYAARKLGMKSTGNAGGNANLVLAPGPRDFEGMLRELGTGLLVTELMGQGINMVTGDYSRGAFGYWEEITIAGNLRDMFRNVVAIGGDALTRGSRTCGSILVEGMTIAGA